MKRASQPVVLATDHLMRMQPKDMNDIFYVRHGKNLSDLYSKAGASFDD